MPEDTYAQQRQQICAVLWFVRSMNMERLYMVSELIATDKRAKRLRLVDFWRFIWISLRASGCVVHTLRERSRKVERRKGQRCSKEFRQQAVERMNACGNVVALARDLGVAR